MSRWHLARDENADGGNALNRVAFTESRHKAGEQRSQENRDIWFSDRCVFDPRGPFRIQIGGDGL